MEKLAEWKANYEHFTLKYHNVIGTFESLARSSLFMMPSRLQGTDLKSEIVYTITSVVSLMHDLIYLKHFRIYSSHFPHQSEKSEVSLPTPQQLQITKWIAFFRSIELLVEMCAYSHYHLRRRLPHEKCREEWWFVLAIEGIKAFLKLLLLLRLETGSILKTTSLPPRSALNLERIASSSYLDHPLKEDDVEDEGYKSEEKKHNVDPFHPKRPTLLLNLEMTIHQKEASYRKFQTFAELLWIFRPVVYVLARMKWGCRSWSPWLMAFLLDCLSLRISKGKTEEEKRELSNRQSELMFYLTRSPLSQMIGSFVPSRLSFITILLDAFSYWHFSNSAS